MKRDHILNGTDQGMLRERHAVAIASLLGTLNSVHELAPHGRDFTPDRYRQAALAHANRMASLRGMLLDLRADYEDLCNEPEGGYDESTHSADGSARD